MGAHRIADALYRVGGNIHAVLRDVQHRLDAEHDPWFGRIEQQLISALQEVDHLTGLLELHALEELVVETDKEVVVGPPS
jgi:hypothetical protein